METAAAVSHVISLAESLALGRTGGPKSSMLRGSQTDQVHQTHVALGPLHNDNELLASRIHGIELHLPEPTL